MVSDGGGIGSGGDGSLASKLSENFQIGQVAERHGISENAARLFIARERMGFINFKTVQNCGEIMREITR